MVELSEVLVRNASVTLVSNSVLDPQSIRPEALSNAGIVPREWIVSSWSPPGGIAPQGLAQTRYHNGFAIQIQENRCDFLQPVGGNYQKDYAVHVVSKRFVEATKLVPYTAIGINWSLDLYVEDPYRWMDEKVFGSGGNFSDHWATSMSLMRPGEEKDCNLEFTIQGDRITLSVNFHFLVSGVLPNKLAAVLDSWEKCQAELIEDVCPRIGVRRS